MSDFYISLPSHSSKTEFPNNKANSFKIRLPHPIRLEGEGWKVGLSSISLPDPVSQVPALLTDKYANLFKTYWLSSSTLLVGRDNETFNALFESRDLGDKDLSKLTGKEFMNSVRGFFNKKIISTTFQAGWKISEDDGSNKTHAHFEWQGDDFVVNNQDVKLTEVNSIYFPTFHVNAKFAVDMGWFNELGGGKYGLGPNLSIELTQGTIPTPVDTSTGGVVGDQFWAYNSSSGLLRLTMTCNWRFINLNASFQNVLGSTKRSLFIYSDVGGSGVVGNQVTDLLREVNYNREGKGYQYFEPLHIQYLPVRKDVVDIIETEVAETTGDLVQFGEGNTIVTLHFKKS